MNNATEQLKDLQGLVSELRAEMARKDQELNVCCMIVNYKINALV